MSWYKSFFVLLALSALSLHTFAQDTAKVVTDNGKKYQVHVVQDNETLYSLSRKYDVPIRKIINANPSVEFGLTIGEEVRIPFRDKKDEKEKRNQEKLDTPKTGKEAMDVHVVQPKETLFAISRMYDVDVNDLKLWNGLRSDSLNIGQRLIIRKQEKKLNVDNNDTEKPFNPGKTHVVQPSETLYSLSKKYEVSINDLKEWNGLMSNELSIGQELIVTKARVLQTEKITLPEGVDSVDAERYEQPEAVTKTKSSTGTFEEVVETGLAGLIDGSNTTRKYLALHRTAKVGTIMKVRNEMNGQEVFVRILGRLPDTTSNKNVVIKISKSAYDRLGAIDPRFRVVVSYTP